MRVDCRCVKTNPLPFFLFRPLLRAVAPFVTHPPCDSTNLDRVHEDEYVDSHLDQLYNDGGLSSLAVTLRRAFDELRHVELRLADATAREGEERGNKGGGHRRIRSMPANRIADSRVGSAEGQRTMEAPPQWLINSTC